MIILKFLLDIFFILLVGYFLGRLLFSFMPVSVKKND